MITKPFLGTERTAAGSTAQKSLPPHVAAVSEELKAAHRRALSEARPVVEKAKPGCLLQLVRGFCFWW